MDNKITWQLLLTDEQYNCIIEGMETYSRLLAGQIEELRRVSPKGYLLDDRLVKEVKNQLFPNLDIGASYNYAGYPLGTDHYPKKIAQSYQIYREMEHQRVKDKGISNVYSSPTLPSTLATKPVVTRIEETDNE